MKHQPIRTIAVGGILALTVAAAALPLGRGKYESPPYQIETSDGAFEIRKYPALTVVTTPLKPDRTPRDPAFMKLFRYISGHNATSLKIPMTTPVFTHRENDHDSMSFVLPANVAKAGPPAAKDNTITISKRDAGRFAVYRYSGRWTEEKSRAARETLAAWITRHGLQPTGVPETANYDPPYTPPPLRRNEVLLRIAR